MTQRWVAAVSGSIITNATIAIRIVVAAGTGMNANRQNQTCLTRLSHFAEAVTQQPGNQGVTRSEISGEGFGERNFHHAVFSLATSASHSGRNTLHTEMGSSRSELAIARWTNERT